MRKILELFFFIYALLFYQLFFFSFCVLFHLWRSKKCVRNIGNRTLGVQFSSSSSTRTHHSYSRHSSSSDLYQLIGWRLTMGSHTVHSRSADLVVCTSACAHGCLLARASNVRLCALYAIPSRLRRKSKGKLKKKYISLWCSGGFYFMHLCVYVCAHIRAKQAGRQAAKQPNK